MMDIKDSLLSGGKKEKGIPASEADKACPNSGKVSADAWELEKTRGQGPDPEIPATTFETTMGKDVVVDKGILSIEKDSPEY